MRASRPASWAGSLDEFNASLNTEPLGFFRAILARAIRTEVTEKILKQRFALQCEAKKAAPGCRGANSRLAFVSLRSRIVYHARMANLSFAAVATLVSGIADLRKPPRRNVDRQRGADFGGAGPLLERDAKAAVNF
jgi:hypothetical protein